MPAILQQGSISVYMNDDQHLEDNTVVYSTPCLCHTAAIKLCSRQMPCLGTATPLSFFLGSASYSIAGSSQHTTGWFSHSNLSCPSTQRFIATPHCSNTEQCFLIAFKPSSLAALLRGQAFSATRGAGYQPKALAVVAPETHDNGFPKALQ